jgi:hypothetical protein
MVWRELPSPGVTSTQQAKHACLMALMSGGSGQSSAAAGSTGSKTTSTAPRRTVSARA